jgi:hypothetical protein
VTESVERLVPVLKPADWSPDDVVARRIVDQRACPWVACGWDFPTHFRFLRSADLEELGLSREGALDRAIENLAAQELVLREIAVGMPDGDRVWVLCVDEVPWADAALLDAALMRRAALRLNAAVVAAVTPIRGLLVLGDATDREQLVALAAVAAEAHVRADRPPITDEIWLWTEGDVVGLGAGVEASREAVDEAWTPPRLDLLRVTDQEGRLRALVAPVPPRGVGQLERDARSLAGALLERAQTVEGFDGVCVVALPYLPGIAPPELERILADLRVWAAELAGDVGAVSRTGRPLRLELTVGSSW